MRWTLLVSGWLCATTLLVLVPAEAQDRSAAAEGELASYDTARRGTATVEDAYRVFLELAVSHRRVKLTSEVSELNFDEVKAELEALCIIDPGWQYTAGTCLRRDVLAYMACSYMGCRPGLFTGVLGMTRRYAHREMLYQGVIPPGAPGTLVSGSEVLSVASRVHRRVGEKRDVRLSDDEIH